MEGNIRDTLKDNGGSGETYTEAQKNLMIWYAYFFLTRGKPSTHILALSQIGEVDLNVGRPEVIGKLIKTASEMLSQSTEKVCVA